MPAFAPRLTLAADAAIDLQMHTTYSDGVWTPEQLLEYLAGEGFGLAAITDHDRVDTSAALQALAAQKQAPPLLTAAEMSASWRGEPTDVLCYFQYPQRVVRECCPHRASPPYNTSVCQSDQEIVHYGFDLAEGALSALAQEVRRGQTENTREVCENLRRKGVVFASGQPDELAALLEQPSAQQPHALVALLKKHGYGTGEPSAGRMITEAGFFWVTVDLVRVVEAAHRGGGVCLIAHPGRGDGYTRFDAPLLDELRQEMPIDGFEVYYPAHSPEQIAMYLAYAQKHDLLISSGSDSHGPEKKPIKYQAALSRRLLERLGVEIA